MDGFLIRHLFKHILFILSNLVKVVLLHKKEKKLYPLLHKKSFRRKIEGGLQ